MTDARNLRGIEIPDYCTADNAAHLARKLEEYWSRRGLRVRPKLVTAGVNNERIYQLRSDMIGGWPRDRQ